MRWRKRRGGNEGRWIPAKTRKRVGARMEKVRQPVERKRKDSLENGTRITKVAKGWKTRSRGKKNEERWKVVEANELRWMIKFGR